MPPTATSAASRCSGPARATPAPAAARPAAAPDPAGCQRPSLQICRLGRARKAGGWRVAEAGPKVSFLSIGSLGTGFYEASLERGLEYPIDFIGADAGSTDGGPVFLAG